MITKLYNGAVTLEFDEGKHVYYANGERAWGVTSATGTIDKSGPLIYWAVNKKCIPYIKERIEPGKPYDELELNKIFTDAAQQHTRHKQDAADIGTMAHEWIEKYIKYRINKRYEFGSEPYLKPEYMIAPVAPINPTLQNLVGAFLKWEAEHQVEFLESETKVYSRKHNYAGTMDIEAEVDGELAVVDIKTSNHIVDEYRFQVAGYIGARIEELKKKYKSYWILRLGKEKKVDDAVEFEARRYDAKKELKADLSAFIGALNVYKRLQQLKPSWNKE